MVMSLVYSSPPLTEEPAMFVAYLSHDEVNSALADRVAGRFGLDLVVLTLRDAEHALAADRLVLDLDHLPPECKAKLFLRVGRGELRGGVTVHSYHLTDAEAGALRAAGVRVARRLTTAILVPKTAVGPSARRTG